MNPRCHFSQFTMIVILLQSFVTIAQENEIQNIRKLYYQNLPFDTIAVYSNKMIPGLGMQNFSLYYVYYDCKYYECEESLISDNPVLRKVVLDKSVNTSVLHAEFLYNQSGTLIFQFQRIGSEDYFYETGRECGEERFYLKAGKPLQVRILPCEESEYFDEIEMNGSFSEGILARINQIIKDGKNHQLSFKQVLNSMN